MRNLLVILTLILGQSTFSQKLPSPSDVLQIHSGHSLTDPLFANWPGQFVNLVGAINSVPGWSLVDVMVGKSTIPGSQIRARWENSPGFGSPDARLDIANWELLCITERVPMLYEGGGTQQWYLDGIAEQKQYLSLFVNNAWNNGNNGNGAPTLLWSTWVNIDGSNGNFRQMLDTQGEEWERMQDYANQNKPSAAPPVYMIPGHKMMARIFDDIQLGIVPGISDISELFSDNIHPNEIGAYAVSLIHYACIFNQSPVGLSNNLLPGAPTGTLLPSPALANYFQNIIWDVVTNYNRTGITDSGLNLTKLLDNKAAVQFYPNPAQDLVTFNYKLPESNSELSIHDLTGKKISTSIFSEKQGEYKLNVNQFDSGVYFVSLSQDGIVLWNEKLVIQ